MSNLDKTNQAAETVAEETVAAPAKAKRNWRSNRKLRLGATATAITVVVAAVVVILNVVFGILADRFPWTLDLTADGTYSLSDQSHDVADTITKDIRIEVLLSEEMFSNPSYTEEENTVLRQFYLFTKEYESLTGGKVTTKYIDLEKNPTLASSYLKQYEAEVGDILFICENQFRLLNVADLMSSELVDYYSGTYSYSSLVEQKLATNLSSINGGKTITVTFLTGHGEDANSIAALKKLYELNGYFTQTLDFTAAGQISDTAGALVIVGPKTDYSIDEIARLRTWLRNDGKLGRNLFVFCNYAGNCPNLYDFLKADYGITVTNNLIVETNLDNYPMDFYGGQPYLPFSTIKDTELTEAVLNKKVIMPFTLQLLSSRSTNTEQEVKTAHSMIEFPESARLISSASLNDLMSGKEPAQLKADSYPIYGMVYARDLASNSETYTNTTNQIMVCGSYLVANYVTSTEYENEGLLLEPLRTTCSLGDTVVISGKDLSQDTVLFSTGAILTLGAVFVIAIPLILIVSCLVVFFKRRHL